MKKGVFLLCLCFCLMACSRSEIKDIDLRELSQRLNETSAFNIDLTRQMDENAKKIAGLTDFEIHEIILYVNEGISSDRILLIKAEKDTLQEIMDYLKKENVSLQESYASYDPKEVPKLENAVLKIIQDEVLLYCVSEDHEAIEKELNDYIKEK